MTTRQLIFSDLLSVLVEDQMKQEIRALARVKQMTMSLFIRYLLSKQLPQVVEHLDEYEARAYTAIKQEFALEEQVVADKIAQEFAANDSVPAAPIVEGE